MVPDRRRWSGVHADDDLATRPQSPEPPAPTAAVFGREFLADVKTKNPTRVGRDRRLSLHDSGRHSAGAVEQFRHNQVLHEQILFVTILTEEVPRVAEENRGSR